MAEWVHIGTEEMQAAQDRLGLSNERLAPELYVVSKTWERWKARGAVPRGQLPRVAQVLGLEVEATPPVRVFTAAGAGEDEAARWAQVDGRLARIEAAVESLLAASGEPPPERAANGQ